MEDHQEAYFFWKELGFQGATCVHVDAHLDVSNFKAPGLGALETPELNCANFLHRALQEGMVGHLIWVIPPQLVGGRSLLDWLRDELLLWMHLSVADYVSLAAVDSRVEGTLLGKPFTVCTSAGLPALAGPVLLDVDIDYFLGPSDEVWQSPLELARALGPLEVSALTVAVSVLGGYTPVHLRYLGEVTVDVFSAGGNEGFGFIKSLDNFSGSSEGGGAEGPGLGTAGSLPPWAAAALAAQEARAAGEEHAGPGWDRAAALDPRYRPRPFDVATLYFIRRQHERCREWLGRVEGDLARAGLYLEGMMALREGRDADAVAHFDDLLTEALDERTQAHLLELCGRALLRLGQGGAVERLRAALRLDSADASLWRELARAQRAAGDPTGAARSLRKALTLAPGALASLDARLDLAELYLESGQVGLAQAEMRALQLPGVPAQYGLEAQRLSLRLARSRS